MAVAPSQNTEAFEAYVKIRRRTSAKLMLARLQERCVSYRANLRDLSEQQAGRREQKQDAEGLRSSMLKLRGRLTEALQEIDSIESSLESYESVSMGTIRKEFARICASPHLIDLSVNKEGRLQLIIAARYSYMGTEYDLGDWAIEIGHKNTKHDLRIVDHIYEIRSGVNPGWVGHAPVYRIGDRSFCLGDNYDIVEEYLRQRDYIAAIEVIMFSLCNINQEDVTRVPNAFKRAA